MTIEELKEEKMELEEKIRAALTEFCISTRVEVRGQFFADPYFVPDVTINPIEI